MPENKLFQDLQKNFGLKDRHVLVLKCLNERKLTAPQICKCTGIPQGRIYGWLNQLLELGLIDKSEKKPTIYSMENVPDKVLSYLKHNMDDFITKESEIIAQLGKIESKQKIDIIDNKKDFTFALSSFFSECKSRKIKTIYQIGRHQSMPFLLYPLNKKHFTKLREMVCNKRPTVSHSNMSYSLIIYKSYRELVDAGVKFNIIVERDSLNYHINLIKKELGEDFIRIMVSDLMERINKGNITVYVLDDYLTMGADISKNRLLLSLIHLGFVTAINVHSKEISEVYTKMFESMADRSVPLEQYLKSKGLVG